MRDEVRTPSVLNHQSVPRERVICKGALPVLSLSKGAGTGGVPRKKHTAGGRAERGVGRDIS